MIEKIWATFEINNFEYWGDVEVEFEIENDYEFESDPNSPPVLVERPVIKRATVLSISADSLTEAKFYGFDAPKTGDINPEQITEIDGELMGLEDYFTNEVKGKAC